MKANRTMLFLLFIASCLLFNSCSSNETPEKPKKAAIIRITVDSSPILMEWDRRVKLWYARPVVTIAETNGVGATITTVSLEFIYKGQAGYEKQSTGGGRLNANTSKTVYLEVGTKYYGYEAMRFSIVGTDDNGHNVSQHRDVSVHYVE